MQEKTYLMRDQDGGRRVVGCKGDPDIGKNAKVFCDICIEKCSRMWVIESMAGNIRKEDIDSI